MNDSRQFQVSETVPAPPAAVFALLADPARHAEIDGAGPWQRIRRIVVPMLGRTTALVTLLQVIASLKVFDQIYLMTGGGPEDATRPIIEYAYDMGFTSYRIGYASAVSYILFVLIVVVSLVQLRLFRKREEASS